jgi:hypothetical protein
MVPTLRTTDGTDFIAWKWNFCLATPLRYCGLASVGIGSSRYVARTKRSAARELPGRDELALHGFEDGRVSGRVGNRQMHVRRPAAGEHQGL